MTKAEISKALRVSAGSQAFITATQLARVLGQKNSYRVKKKYLEGLEHVNGLYFIPEVSGRIMEEVRCGNLK
jgi:hypothetical protein